MSSDDPNGLSNAHARLLFNTKLLDGATFLAAIHLHADDLTLTRGLTMLKQLAPLGATVNTILLFPPVYRTTRSIRLFRWLRPGTVIITASQRPNVGNLAPLLVMLIAAAGIPTLSRTRLSTVLVLSIFLRESLIINRPAVPLLVTVPVVGTVPL